MSEPVDEPSLQDVTPDAEQDPEDSSEVSPEDQEGLPPDLVPGEDNPLAKGLPDGESAGDLLEDGKQAEQTVYAPGEGTGEVVERRMTGSDDEEQDEEQDEDA
jgi:hypothetical protein